MNNSLTGFCHSVKVTSPYGRNLKAGRRITAERSGAHGPSQLILWWVLVFLSIGWIVFYINAVTKNSAAVFSPPLTLFALLSAATFLLLLVLFWRHNQITHTIRSPTSVGIPTGNVRSLPALWHFNGAGIDFSQRSRKAEDRYVAKVLLSEGAREAGREQA
jgi:hypothetical protein